MNYSEEFKKLLRETIEGYIGHGNPNAKILFLGQEPGWDREDPEQNVRYLREIKENKIEWKALVAESFGYDQIKEYVANFNKEKDHYDFFSPLNPWPLQKYQVLTWKEIEREDQNGGRIKERVLARGKEGTARTWHRYQTLINLIFGEHLSQEDGLTLHRKSFHTDMSDASYKKHDARLKGCKEAVNARKDLLQNDFFRKFPIVIAAVGNFPKDCYERGDEYFKDVFQTSFRPEKSISEWPWINVNIREDENPQLLIHCPQLSAPLSNAYLGRIAEIVRDFAKKHNIDLNPAE